jgi:SAM-dependent methyltransferase
MRDLSWNKATWDSAYNWSQRGEEWSHSWGSSEAQWFGAILPRIHRYLPARRILEIAPGFGRWTRFLIGACTQYQGVDLSASCVDFCSKEFAAATHASFHTNDGVSLDMVEDGSCDFVFSFDSLVHAELDVLEQYARQIVRKLAPNGVALIHHSNWKERPRPAENPHNRAESVSYTSVHDAIVAVAGQVLIQEIIVWGTDDIDALTLFGRAEDTKNHKPVLVRNTEFMSEAKNIRNHIDPWCGPR